MNIFSRLPFKTFLQIILTIGFRVRSKRGTQFLQWANRHLSEYMVKGFVMDDERLKNPGGRPDYFNLNNCSKSATSLLKISRQWISFSVVRFYGTTHILLFQT